MQQKVLVTGANGLLGAHLVRQLNKAGYAVRILVRPNCDMSALHGAKFETYVGEIIHPKTVNDAVEGCDYVIHAAARTTQYPTKLEAYYTINVEATQTIINACLTHRVKRLAYISTVNCFTPGSNSIPGNENSAFMPWLKASGYAYSKFLAQQKVLQACQNSGLDAVVLAPTFLLGAYDAKPSSGKLLQYAYAQKILFYPFAGKNFVDAAFAAEACVQALVQAKKGECYVLGGENMSYRSFYQRVARLSGKKKVLIPVPNILIRFAGWIGQGIQVLFNTSFSLNRVNARLFTLDNYFSNEKARQQLGLKSTRLDKALLESSDWMKKAGML